MRGREDADVRLISKMLKVGPDTRALPTVAELAAMAKDERGVDLQEVIKLWRPLRSLRSSRKLAAVMI